MNQKKINSLMMCYINKNIVDKLDMKEFMNILILIHF